jgi:hypothetical protein
MKLLLPVIALVGLLGFATQASAGVHVSVGAGPVVFGPGYYDGTYYGPGYYDGYGYGGPGYIGYYSYNRGYYHHGYHHSYRGGRR